jgi:hypothetical protein
LLCPLPAPDFVGSYPQLAFIAVLLLALSEAIPVIGTVVPGSTLILAISALAIAADVKPWLLLIAANAMRRAQAIRAIEKAHEARVITMIHRQERYFRLCCLSAHSIYRAPRPLLRR